MSDRIWAFYARRGVAQDVPETWPTGLSSKNQGLRQSGVFNRFANRLSAFLLDDLLGTGTWTESEGWGPALITWPEPGPWHVPGANWHLDLPARGDPDRPGAARLFGFISEVKPQAGGTLVVEGTHELVRRLIVDSPGQDAGQSSDVLKKLRRLSPWIAALSRPEVNSVQRFMLDGDDVDGVRVRVAELTGAPGDVVIMMPWSLHTFSTNSSLVPRFMVTHTVLSDYQRFYPSIPISTKRGPLPLRD